MNPNQRKLLVASLLLFWLSVFYLPHCGGGAGDFCGVMDGYNFIFHDLEGIYLPTLFVEWIGIGVSFIALYFYFEE